MSLGSHINKSKNNKEYCTVQDRQNATTSFFIGSGRHGNWPEIQRSNTKTLYRQLLSRTIRKQAS